MVGRIRQPTSTSAFGVSGREAHDATDFYRRFPSPSISGDEALGDAGAADKLLVGDARSMTEVPDASVALVVTSPPYFAGKEYEQDLGAAHIPASYADYLQMLEDVFAESVRALEPGGRIAVNVANLGRRPYRSLSADVTGILQDRLGLLLRGEIIWRKARGAGGSCAWGSFCAPTNPVLRDLTERVIVACKGRFDRARTPTQRRAAGQPCEATLGTDEFMDATLDVWDLPAEQASRIGHPAPFPVELPRRLIELYTFGGDVVLDPFVGSGTTAVAAVRTGRRYLGYDTDPAYITAAEARVEAERDRARAPVVRTSAIDVAGRLLTEAGFTDLSRRHRLTGIGVDVSWSAVAPDGRLWLLDVVGGFTVIPTGLSRLDMTWRALGRAAATHAAYPQLPLVLATTDPAPASGPAAAALTPWVGPRKAIRAVLDLHRPDQSVAALRRLGRPTGLGVPSGRSD